MHNFDSSPRQPLSYFLFLFLISLGVKLIASQLLVWEADYVPVIARGQAWLDGGAFPAVGTLSSVAAYNMPFLAWIQIPVMLFTRDVATILIVTQLIFNFIATWFVYRLSSEMFSPTAGLIGAALFTFSETGISSAYTAWAQMLLPGFYVIFVYCLYRWKTDSRTRYVALTCIIATAAFMTHFSAVLLYAIIVIFWLILRLPFNFKGLAIGLFISGLLLAPYMILQVERDFVDLKAFFTRQTTIDKTVLDEYAYLKPENQRVENPETSNSEQSPETETDTPSDSSRPTTRLERGIEWVLTIPSQVIGGLRLAFTSDLQNLRQHYPILHQISNVLRLLLEVAFWGGIGFAVYRYIVILRLGYATSEMSKSSFRSRLQFASSTLIDTPAGRNLILLLFALGIISGLILVRAGPQQQATYYTGLFSIQFVMCAYGIYSFMERRYYGARVLILVILFIGLGTFDRIVRVRTHDVKEYSLFNVWLYRSIDEATGWIAEDWDGESEIRVSYDVMPEMAHQWWVAPWHTVDESYRIGMAYDYLLSSYHGLVNQNTNPVGLADDPNYVVTYETGLDRYDLSQYQVQQFGAIYVLTPERS